MTGKPPVRERFNAVRDNEVARQNMVLSLPNVISAVRVALVPLLFWLALNGRSNDFLIVLAVSLLTDGLDGFLARRLGQVTTLGSHLDSWADLATYAVMLFGLWRVWPEIFTRESGYLIVAFSSWLVPVLVCLTRFGRFPNYHTHAAKLAALGLAPAYFLLILFDYSWVFRAVLLFFLWVALEQVIITSILPRWRGDVAGFWRAWEIARQEENE